VVCRLIALDRMASELVGQVECGNEKTLKHMLKVRVENSGLGLDCGTGIEIDAGSDHNTIDGNDIVEQETPEVFYAALDLNPDCGKDSWTGNTFTGLISPESCID
jgi:hypothetical protein